MEKKTDIVNSLSKSRIQVESSELNSISIRCFTVLMGDIKKTIEVLVRDRFLSQDFALEIAANYPDGEGGSKSLALNFSKGLLAIAAERIFQLEKPWSGEEKEKKVQFLLNLESKLSADPTMCDEEKIQILVGGLLHEGITRADLKETCKNKIREIEQSFSSSYKPNGKLYEAIIDSLDSNQASEKSDCVPNSRSNGQTFDLKTFVEQHWMSDDGLHPLDYYRDMYHPHIDSPLIGLGLFNKNNYRDLKKDTYCGFEPGFLIGKRF